MSDLTLLLSNYLYIWKKLEINVAKKFCPLLKGNVLDIGCGDKPYKHLLYNSSKYFSMEYSDISQKPDLFGDVNRLPFKNTAFDAILFNEVIEHIPNPTKGIEEIYRVLKKDGKLFLTAPMYWRLHYSPQDYFRFTNHGLTYILENNNFHILEIERMGGFFSLVFIRLIDIFVTKIFFKFTSFISLERGKYRIAALLMSPFSFTGYYLGKILDLLDKDDALLWAVFALKK